MNRATNERIAEQLERLETMMRANYLIGPDETLELWRRVDQQTARGETDYRLTITGHTDCTCGLCDVIGDTKAAAFGNLKTRVLMLAQLERGQK